MARRYTRDNRGRFASVGATARGGRLATASGNKRATQTERIAGGKPAGTIGKSGKAKPAAIKPKQQRKLEAERINLSRRADATSARMGYTNAQPGDAAKLHKSASADRARIAQIDKQLAGSKPLPQVVARGRGLTGENMGKYRGDGRFSLYGKDRGKIGRERLPSTVRKPKGLQPGALTPKPAAKPSSKPAAKSKAQRDIESAQRRLKTKRYGDTANQNQALIFDRRIASMTPQQLAGSRVRGARADIARTRRKLRDPINNDAPPIWRERVQRSLAEQRQAFRDAANDYRSIKPKRKTK